MRSLTIQKSIPLRPVRSCRKNAGPHGDERNRDVQRPLRDRVAVRDLAFLGIAHQRPDHQRYQGEALTHDKGDHHVHHRIGDRDEQDSHGGGYRNEPRNGQPDGPSASNQDLTDEQAGRRQHNTGGGEGRDRCCGPESVTKRDCHHGRADERTEAGSDKRERGPCETHAACPRPQLAALTACCHLGERGEHASDEVVAERQWGAGEQQRRIGDRELGGGGPERTGNERPGQQERLRCRGREHQPKEQPLLPHLLDMLIG